MDILVTGGTGFTGAALVLGLLRKGHRVRAMDLKGGIRDQELTRHGAELIFGTVTDKEALNEASKGCQAVFHLAAAFRELEEETGTANVVFLAEATEWLKYDFPDELRTRAWNGKWRGQMQKWFALQFLGVDDEIDVRGVDQPEFARWRWVSPEVVPSLIVDFKRPVYEAVIAEFDSILSPA